MSEAAKQRMEAKIQDLYSNPRGRRIAAELYQAGMQDPDSVKNHPVVRELVEALIAVQKYDSAIFVRAENGDLELDPMGALVGGHDLDALYMDMKTKTDDALTKWQEFVEGSNDPIRSE